MARTKAKRLVIPAALVVSVTGLAAGAIASIGAGCRDHQPVVDAGHGDAKPDTPII